MAATSHLGKPISRIDGRAKVTGVAKYAAEYNVPGLAHGVVVSSSIAKGRIKRIHVADALAVEGVLDVFTHEHRPKLLHRTKSIRMRSRPPAPPFVRSMTPKSFSTDSQWRWSSPRNSRSRDLRLHWSASTMSGRHTSPTSTASAGAARFRSETPRTPPSAASP